MERDVLLNHLTELESSLRYVQGLIHGHQKITDTMIETMDVSDYLNSEAYLWNSVLKITDDHLSTALNYLLLARIGEHNGED